MYHKLAEAHKMKADVVKNALVLTSIHRIEGDLVLTTTCRDFDSFAKLPAVVSYKGTECGKSGWSSDTGIACYKSSANIAHSR